MAEAKVIIIFKMLPLLMKRQRGQEMCPPHGDERAPSEEKEVMVRRGGNRKSQHKYGGESG